MISIRKYTPKDIPAMLDIWNNIVEKGLAFPQMDKMDFNEGERFFAEQTFTAVAIKGNEVVGLYILHPNNIGRCGHIANSSYAVKSNYRGLKIGEKLVHHSLEKAMEYGFRIMQFNAVVISNATAIHLYEKIGFQRLGIIPKGFLLKNGEYEDIILYYIELGN